MDSSLILISNRGNLEGADPSRENSVPYVRNAIDSGYHVLVDVWVCEGRYALGSDEPSYSAPPDVVLHEKAICRARDSKTLAALLQDGAHCFFQEKDDFVCTSRGWIWTSPGTQLPPTKGIIAFPEYTPARTPDPSSALGVCSNKIAKIRRNLESHGAITAIQRYVKIAEEEQRRKEEEAEREAERQRVEDERRREAERLHEELMMAEARQRQEEQELQKREQQQQQLQQQLQQEQLQQQQQQQNAALSEAVRREEELRAEIQRLQQQMDPQASSILEEACVCAATPAEPIIVAPPMSGSSVMDAAQNMMEGLE
jgi:hypothetical protein